MALQDRHGIGLGKIFELNKHSWPALLCGIDEEVYKGVVFWTSDAPVPLTHIHGVIERLLIIGTNIQSHRQSIGWTDATASGVDRELADGDAHATNTLVAKAKH